MTCEQCELNKRRAQLWRHEAYKLAGYPLDWEPELAVRREWQGLTDAEIKAQRWLLSGVKEYEQYTGREQLSVDGFEEFARAIEAKLKEKNHD